MMRIASFRTALALTYTAAGRDQYVTQVTGWHFVILTTSTGII